jgi:predicted transcriptional regulator
MIKEYRERYLIISRMLGVINDRGTAGATKTLIMYKAYLSYAQLKEYLSFLLERGLVEELPQQVKSSGANERTVYKITGKGIKLLQISKEIEGIVGLD